MKKITFYFLVFASVLLVSCNKPAAPAHSEDDMIAAAKALDAKFIDAMNAENVDGVMSCYWNSPDLVVYSPGALEEKGYDAVKASFTKWFAESSGAKHELSDAIYKVMGDHVLAYGKVKMSMDNPDTTAARIELEGRFTSIMAYKDSNLVYVVDHASIPLPPSPPPAPIEAKK